MSTTICMEEPKSLTRPTTHVQTEFYIPQWVNVCWMEKQDDEEYPQEMLIETAEVNFHKSKTDNY